ncbi:hypothetical protein ACWD4J_12790 [Streptomyces sp. NPDC002577]
MPEDTLDTTNLKSQYVTQVAGDLERNAKEQERISGELTALEGQLQALRRDHALLETVQQALTDGKSAPLSDAEASTASPEPAVAPKPAAVPTARKPKDGGKTAGNKTTGRKAAADKATADKAAGDKAATKGRKKAQPAAVPAKQPQPKAAGSPTLRDLVLGHIGGQSEPRSSAEVTTGLAEAHPDRTFQGTVVRNTLEALVAKGHVQRNKQQKSVFYFAAGNTPAPAAETDDTAQKDDGSSS